MVSLCRVCCVLVDEDISHSVDEEIGVWSTAGSYTEMIVTYIFEYLGLTLILGFGDLTFSVLVCMFVLILMNS